MPQVFRLDLSLLLQRVRIAIIVTKMSEAFTRPTRSLAGRVAIVSGAGAAADGIGNGRASAILLAEAGCSVVCVDMKQELAARTAEMINKDGFAKAVAVAGNASVAEDCKNAVQTALSNFGRTLKPDDRARSTKGRETQANCSTHHIRPRHISQCCRHWWSSWNSQRSRYVGMG